MTNGIGAFLVSAVSIAVPITIPLITFSIGLETGGPSFAALFARPGLILRYFLASFVVMPGIAIALGYFAVVPQYVWAGLALLSIAPPAPPASNRLRKTGNRDIGLAWQAVAFLIAVVTIPATIAVADSLGLVGRELNLSWGPMLQRSAMFFALPMLAGLLLRQYVPSLAAVLEKPVTIAANIGLIVVVLLVLVIAIPVVVKFGIVSIAVVLAFLVVAILVAHLFGGPGRDTRVTLAAMLAARFPVPALVLAAANGVTKEILPVVIVYVLAGALLVPLYDRLVTRPGASA